MPLTLEDRKYVEQKMKELKEETGLSLDSKAFLMRLSFFGKTTSKKDMTIYKERGTLSDEELLSDHRVMDLYHNLYTQFLKGSIHKMGMDAISSRLPLDITPSTFNHYEDFMKSVFADFVKENITLVSPKYHFGNMRKTDLDSLKGMFDEDNRRDSYFEHKYAQGTDGMAGIADAMTDLMEKREYATSDIYDLAAMYKLVKEDYDSMRPKDKMFSKPGRTEKKVLQDSSKFIMGHVSVFEKKNLSLSEIADASAASEVISMERYERTLDILEDAIVNGTYLSDTLDERVRVTLDVDEEETVAGMEAEITAPSMEKILEK